MTDKEKIRAEIERLKEETSIGLSEHDNGVEQGRIEVINSLYKTLDHMQDESVSKDLDSFAKRQADEFAEREYEVGSYDRSYLSKGYYWGCKAGANWQERQMMAKAVDGIVRPDDGEIWVDFKLHNFMDGDKVKVIVIKK